ncbi:MAG: DUF2155 domain-containing protein [Alphaproteobacteria bacterium]|nr:DUF2155 domain-containing protein [Alphaproteobacteria bacterium]
MKISSVLKLGFFSVLSISSMAVANEISTNSALMQSMDKVTGRVKKITVPVNSKIAYGDFSLVLRACKKRPAEETPENFAFVDVTDKSFGGEEYNIFRGWMLSSTPGINAIEHPIYDIWLLECMDSDISNTTLLSQAELDRRDKLPSKDFVADFIRDDVEIDNIEKVEKTSKKEIRIKEFISEDRDIEKDISHNTSLPKVEKVENEVNQTQSEPENLLDFTQKEQEDVSEDSVQKEVEEEYDIDSEIYY